LRRKYIEKAAAAMSEANEQMRMHQRRITLADGRYLIFYTFNDSSSSAAGRLEINDVKQPEPEADPEAVEERRV
jgi:hypothetical protein